MAGSLHLGKIAGIDIAAPVTQGEYLAGLITLTDITRVPQERWSSTPVGHVMRLLE
jgi:hypothetical protein